MNTAERPKLEAPEGEKRILLHSCCAPCEGEVLETLLESGIQPTVFFYNPNIHPKREYELRKSEDKRRHREAPPLAKKVCIGVCIL